MFTEPSKHSRATCECQAVLDTGHKALVILSIEGFLTKPSESRILVKVDIVLIEVVVILHVEVIKLQRGGSDRIRFTKGCLEGFLESSPCKGIVGEIFLVKCDVELVPALCGS